jgi:hypothetical protein
MIEAIQRLWEELQIEQNFEWDIPHDAPIVIPNAIEGSFARNVYLKENLSDLLQNDETFDTHYWVIRRFGGIGSFKVGEQNNDRIGDFVQQLPGGRLEPDLFGRISSVSKVASILHPDRYSI